jgi:L-fuconate dehydratase
MSGPVIQSIDAIDARFSLPDGAGSDAMHTSPVYAMSLTHLKTEGGPTGVGLALALGDGNRLVCEAIRMLARSIIGKPIEEVMASFGNLARGMLPMCPPLRLSALPCQDVREYSYFANTRRGRR